MAYSSKIIPPKCHNCTAPAKVRVYSWRNELWGEYCHCHGKQILAMLLKDEKTVVIKEMKVESELGWGGPESESYGGPE